MPASERPLIAAAFPKVEPVIYQRNLISQAVCELRFPTVYGLTRGKPPLALANALRKSFPEHGVVDGLNVGPTGVEQNFAFVFKDKKRRTTITFRPSALNVETTAYQSFEELLAIVVLAATAARETIDADFFTRVGLRYINSVPYKFGEIASWVNPQLVAPLASGLLEGPVEFSGRTAVAVEGGGFLLQHGLAKDEGSKEDRYVLDFDVWREDVAWPELVGELQDLHDAEARLFRWSIGPAALNFMGPARLKREASKP